MTMMEFFTKIFIIVVSGVWQSLEPIGENSSPFYMGFLGPISVRVEAKMPLIKIMIEI